MSESNSQYVDRPGVFLCTVEKPTNGWFGEAGEKETPYLRIPVRVTQQGDGKNDQIGKAMTYQGWLTEVAFDNTIKTLCKAFPSWNGDLLALSGGMYDFTGQDCEIVAASETYQGKTRIKVQWLNPAGGGGGKPMEKTKIDSLIAKLGRKSLAIAKGVQAEAGTAPAARPAPPRTATQAPTGRQAPVVDEEDDIPF
jgi:hypothetical protein